MVRSPTTAANGRTERLARVHAGKGAPGGQRARSRTVLKRVSCHGRRPAGTTSSPMEGRNRWRSTGIRRTSRCPSRPAPRSLIMAWLADDWGGTKRTSSTEERWSPPKGGAMLGVSRTVRGEKMVAFEYLRIVERDGGLVYVAQPGGKSADRVCAHRARQTARGIRESSPQLPAAHRVRTFERGHPDRFDWLRQGASPELRVRPRKQIELPAPISATLSSVRSNCSGDIHESQVIARRAAAIQPMAIPPGSLTQKTDEISAPNLWGR